MKSERQKAGIMSRAISALTYNWGLKLLALALALIVYYSLKTEEQHTVTRNDRLFQRNN